MWTSHYEELYFIIYVFGDNCARYIFVNAWYNVYEYILRMYFLIITTCCFLSIIIYVKSVVYISYSLIV